MKSNSALFVWLLMSSAYCYGSNSCDIKNTIKDIWDRESNFIPREYHSYNLLKKAEKFMNIDCEVTDYSIINTHKDYETAGKFRCNEKEREFKFTVTIPTKSKHYASFLLYGFQKYNKNIIDPQKVSPLQKEAFNEFLDVFTQLCRADKIDSCSNIEYKNSLFAQKMYCGFLKEGICEEMEPTTEPQPKHSENSDDDDIYSSVLGPNFGSKN